MKQGRKKMVLPEKGTVLDEARRRMDWVWENFDQLWISFSGGKDSGAVLSMAMDAWDRNGPFTDEDGNETRINILHFDDEFHYPETVEYIERIMDRNGDRLKFWWCAIPIKYGLVTSGLEENDSKYWYPWDPDHEDEWFRQHPFEEDLAERDNVEIVTPEHELIGKHGGDWKHKHIATRLIAQQAVERTMQLVGVRTSESLNRHIALLGTGDWRKGAKERWVDTKYAKDIFGEDGRDFTSGHPVYDWHDRDLWAIHEELGWDYNHAYDKFHQLGWAPGSMRTGNPWGYMAVQSGDPQDTRHHWAEHYDEWIGRHAGMDTAFSWGGDAVGPMCPEDKTWEEYTALLLNNIEDEHTQERMTKLIEGRLERHYDTTRSKLPDSGQCEICSLSWRHMASSVFEEVYGIRTGQS